MSYPDYPNNRLVVNGVDLTTTYSLILMDGYVLGPPSIKTYTVDIPGGNGTLDLTESLLGDTAYGSRKQEFTFYVINASDFEETKTLVSNFLHGRAFDYTLTMDPGYTYHGRFTVESYEHIPSTIGVIGSIKVNIEANPFKFKPMQVRYINAVGGNVVTLASGRKRVRPRIQTDNALKVIFDNKLTILPSGTWTIDELSFTNGDNEVYFNSYDIHNLTWGDLRTNTVTWGQFGQTPLFEWYKSQGSGNIRYRTWGEISDLTWENLSASTWGDLSYLAEVPENIQEIYIAYDWGDL